MEFLNVFIYLCSGWMVDNKFVFFIVILVDGINFGFMRMVDVFFGIMMC